MQLPIIIAEVGNCHEGRVEIGLELIEKAKECGAGLVKFQAGKAEGFATKREDIQKYRKYELDNYEYMTLYNYGLTLGIPVFFSVWSEQFGNYRKFEWFKIPARQCTRENIEKWETGKTFISIPHTMSDEDIIGLNIRRGIPMHCVAEYPAKNGHINRIGKLKELLNRGVGYSDHTVGIDACIKAIEAGADAIEKHFTLSHGFGPLRDHIHAADAYQMEELCKYAKRGDK